MGDKMNEVIMSLNRLERRIGMDGEAVRIQLNSISNCLSDYGPRQRICSFDETLRSVAERWGVANSSVKFPLSSLDGYSSGDVESSDLSSGNDEPMTRGRDRQESADMMGPVDVMQSAMSDIPIPSSSHANETAHNISKSSESDVRSDPVPGTGESKTRGRVRRKKAKKGARPRPRPPLNGLHLSIKSVKRPIYRLRGRRKIMAAHHYRLKPGENSASSLWLKQKQPKHSCNRKGRKKVMVAHHYWLKPGEDMTCPLWLKHQPKYTCSHRASFDLCWPKDPSIIVAHI